MFVDPYFNVCLATKALNLYPGQEIKAMPISHIYPNSVCFAKEKSILQIDHFDIIQGNIGDCWLLSVFSTIAHSYPDKIKNLIKHTDADIGYTIFRILNHDIVVDHYVPVVCTTDGDFDVVGARISKQNEYWPILLEKCFIKLFSSIWCPIDVYIFNLKRNACHYPTYASIHGGFPRWALSVLLGCRIDPIQTNKSNIWDILKCEENEKLIACAMTSTEKTDQHVDEGFVFGHAYAVLYTDYPLIRVRNPWGIVENTQYNDFVDDGEFYVHVDEFVQRFPIICVAKIKIISTPETCANSVNPAL